MKLIPKDTLFFREECYHNKKHSYCEHFFEFTVYDAKKHKVHGNLVCQMCFDFHLTYKTKTYPYLKLTFNMENWIEFIKQFPNEDFISESKS